MLSRGVAEGVVTTPTGTIAPYRDRGVKPTGNDVGGDHGGGVLMGKTQERRVRRRWGDGCERGGASATMVTGRRRDGVTGGGVLTTLKRSEGVKTTRGRVTPDVIETRRRVLTSLPLF